MNTLAGRRIAITRPSAGALGDRLTEKGVSWSWYSGGWNEAEAGTLKDGTFSFHHQPFAFFANYQKGQPGRAHLKDLLDAAERGRVATVRRDAASAAVLDVARLRHFLATVVPSRAQVVPEGGGWSVFIPGLPVAAD